MMNKFEDREKTFEKKFANDQEVQFKVNARRNKYLGEWAALKLGKSGEEVETYIQEAAKYDQPISGANSKLEGMGLALPPNSTMKPATHTENMINDDSRKLRMHVYLQLHLRH